MYAVIFRAKVGQQDQAYFDAVARMRTLAFDKYGCLDFIAVTEGEQEVAISYWPDQASIQAWKSDPEHLLAQQQGRAQWYADYKVQVVRIEREYSMNR